MTPTNYSIPGVSVLLEGDSGTGKTHALSTLIEAGITPFIIFTEQGMSVLGKLGVPIDKCHWHYVSPATQNWADMLEMGKRINTMSYEALTKVADPRKSSYSQFLEVVTSCNRFVDDRTGQDFGDVSSWNTDRALVFDSLTGLSTMSMNLNIGAKPTKSMPDWMIAMDNLERFLTKITQDLRCHKVVISHLNREKNEITGGIDLMPATLGQKLPPKLPPMFDEVIQTLVRSGDFTWSTIGTNIITKTRLLPFSDKLQPSFVPLIEGWAKAGGIIQPTEEVTP